MWDKATADRYEAWLESRKGAFALAREQRLIADIVSPWQRRNQSLLEIGCGTGQFLELFYHGGFEVTGIDTSEAMLEKARERMGHKATLRIGSAAHLPFDDGEFDYVAIVTALECMDEPQKALEEAFRVATRGVVISYLNSWSLYSMEQKIIAARQVFQEKSARRRAVAKGEPLPESRPKRTLEQIRWFNAVQITRMVRKASGKFPDVFRSTLFSPSFLWRGNKPFSLSWWQLFPFGAVSVARVDLVPVAATTMTILAPKVARTMGASAGVVTMDRYPTSKEK